MMANLKRSRLALCAAVSVIGVSAQAQEEASPPPVTSSTIPPAVVESFDASEQNRPIGRGASVFRQALEGNGTGLVFEVGWINWRARKTSTPFAGEAAPLTGSVGPFPLDPDSYTTTSYDTNFGRDNGMRFGTAYRFESGWDVGAIFTTFRSEASRGIGDPTIDADNIIPFRMDRVLGESANLNGDFETGFADAASETLNIHIQNVDLEAGRAFRFVGGSAVVRPFGGIRYTELVQKGQIAYFNLEGADDLDSYRIDERSSMSAVGIRLGSDLSWNFGETGFSVFGRGGLSLLLADIRTSRRDLAYNQSVGDVEEVRFEQKEHGVVPVLETTLGVAYSRGPFYISAGYEFLNFFNAIRQVNQEGWSQTTRRSKTDVTASDVSFDGLFLNTGFIY